MRLSSIAGLDISNMLFLWQTGFPAPGFCTGSSDWALTVTLTEGLACGTLAGARGALAGVALLGVSLAGEAVLLSCASSAWRAAAAFRASFSACFDSCSAILARIRGLRIPEKEFGVSKMPTVGGPAVSLARNTETLAGGECARQNSFTGNCCRILFIAHSAKFYKAKSLSISSARVGSALHHTLLTV